MLRLGGSSPPGASPWPWTPRRSQESLMRRDSSHLPGRTACPRVPSGGRFRHVYPFTCLPPLIRLCSAQHRWGGRTRANRCRCASRPGSTISRPWGRPAWPRSARHGSSRRRQRRPGSSACAKRWRRLIRPATGRPWRCRLKRTCLPTRAPSPHRRGCLAATRTRSHRPRVAALAAAMTNARYRGIEHAGHASHVEQPAAFNAAACGFLPGSQDSMGQAMATPDPPAEPPHHA